MPVRGRIFSLLVILLFSFLPSGVLAERQPNANATYQQLRGLMPGGEIISVNNLELKRDAATFTFHNGDFAFLGEVNGKITGAVFIGQGHLHITPPTAQERHNLAIVSKAEEFDEDFDQVILRFTDGSEAELRKGSTGKGIEAPFYASAMKDFRGFQRNKLHANLDLRLLQDVLSPAKGGLFIAAVHGAKNPHLIFTIDPNGVGDVAPEEVALLNWNQWGTSLPLAFHRAAQYASGAASSKERNSAYTVLNEDLDVTIERNGFLTSLATLDLRAEQDGVTVIPLDLYHTLRVSKVQNAKGEDLDFVQEDKNDDPDFGVILAQPLKKGEAATLKITYGGKDAIRDEGGSNYYLVPGARENWYPSVLRCSGNYHMVFHVTKGLTVLASGTRLSEKTDGKVTTTEWKTDVPLQVAGFALGRFVMKEAALSGKNSGKLTLDAYANTDPPDDLTAIFNVEGGPGAFGRDNNSTPLGNFSAPGLLPMQLSQAQASAQIYSSYFGSLPFSTVAVTQQFDCGLGQSFPTLVYLPICGFLDKTQQNALGINPSDEYWKTVTPHEVAHQWWGETVESASYRDHWMSEGFAETSASIFLQLTRPKPDDFREFWNYNRRLIVDKNEFGFRAIDIGPVTMGFRLSSPKAGWNIYRDLVYPKGAYILHMLRMMMWSQKDGDTAFKAMMRDFATTYRLQPATTEDFKAIVEKHMTPEMDLDNNRRMDWFFNEYVYGIDLPVYHFESEIKQNGDAVSAHLKLEQSGVPAGFKMTVPVYFELADGRVFRLGSIPMVGSTAFDQTIPLPKPPSPVKRVLINYNYDVLSTEN